MKKIISVVFACLFWVVAITAQATAQTQVATKFPVNIMSTPSFSGSIVKNVGAAHPLTVLEDSGQWIKIQDQDGSEGYVSREWIASDVNTVKKEQNRRIREAEADLKAIPESDYQERISQYKYLTGLDPDNDQYKEKIEFYKQKILDMPAFKKTKWGMTRSEVIKSEGREPAYNKGDIVGYEDTILGLDTLIFYSFTGNALIHAANRFVIEHSNNNQFLSDYKSVNDALKGKYGEPKREYTYWSKDLYKDDRKRWGMALAVGHMKKYTTWEMDNTEIIHVVKGDNYKISHSVEYYTKVKSLMETEEKATAKETESKL